ncbi:unnamed protein product [Calypogeia fissa]
MDEESGPSPLARATIVLRGQDQLSASASGPQLSVVCIGGTKKENVWGFLSITSSSKIHLLKSRMRCWGWKLEATTRKKKSHRPGLEEPATSGYELL